MSATSGIETVPLMRRARSMISLWVRIPMSGTPSVLAARPNPVVKNCSKPACSMILADRAS